MNEQEQIARLREENERLREEVYRLKYQQGGQAAPKKTNGCVMAMIIVGVGFAGLSVLSIVAAIALPMYSTFKQKSMVAGALREINDSTEILLEWYGERRTFAGITVDSEGGPLTAIGSPIGANLDPLPGGLWEIQTSDDCIQFNFTWLATSGCPEQACNGYYQMCCHTDPCEITIDVGDNRLGFNRSP